MLTVYGDSDRLFRSLMAGASGYLLKRTTSAGLLAAIREVHCRRLAHDAANRPACGPALSKGPGGVLRAGETHPRETEILAQLAQGFLYKEIGDKPRHQHGHRPHVYPQDLRQLQVHSRTGAMIKYLQRQA